MIKRFYTAIGYLLGGIFISLLLATIPLWLIIWVITGFNPLNFLQRKFNPESFKRAEEIREETKRINEEIEELKAKIKDDERIRRNMDRIKNSN